MTATQQQCRSQQGYRDAIAADAVAGLVGMTATQYQQGQGCKQQHPQSIAAPPGQPFVQRGCRFKSRSGQPCQHADTGCRQTCQRTGKQQESQNVGVTYQRAAAPEQTASQAITKIGLQGGGKSIGDARQQGAETPVKVQIRQQCRNENGGNGRVTIDQQHAHSNPRRRPDRQGILGGEPQLQRQYTDQPVGQREA